MDIHSRRFAGMQPAACGLLGCATALTLALGLTGCTTQTLPLAQADTSEPAGMAEPEFPMSWTFHSGEDTWARHAPLIGQDMPLLDLADWMNGEIDLEKDLDGKVVLVDFWATWCGPCIAAIPKTNDLYETYRDQGLVVIGVCGSPNGQERMEEVAEQHNIRFPIARDHNLVSAETWEVMWWPTYAAVDRQGNVRAMGIRTDRVEDVVTALLAEPAPGR